MAASGLKIVLPGTISDSSLPVLRDDARLTAGSLLLVDLAHSANPLAAGVPVADSAIPNIAWREASALCGVSSPTNASVPVKFRMAGGITGTTSAKGKVERTTKGGIHVICSQATALANGDGVGFEDQSGSLRTYLNANTGHSYYIAAWYQVTRINAQNGTASKQLEMFEFGRASSTADLALLADYTGWTGASGGTVLGAVSDGATQSTGMKRSSYGTTPGASLVMNAASFVGPTIGYPQSSGGSGTNGILIASRNNLAPSLAVYSWHLMDLTVAGLTYAQAEAIDQTAYAAAFGTSGRYNGDTIPTAPSTIA